MTAFEPNKLLKYDNESIIEEIKRVYFKFFKDRRMLLEGFKLHSRVHYTTILRRFNSWENALEQAGIPSFQKTRKLKTSLSEIKSDLERIKELNKGKYFTYAFYKENGGKYYKTISKHFGFNTWEELLNKELELYKEKKIIVIKEKKKSLSEEQLLNELKKVWEKIGRRPTYTEFKKNSSIGISIYETRFGKWTGAIEQFCLKNNNYNGHNVGTSVNTTKELLIQDLQKIKEIHKLEILKFTDYKKYGGNYSSGTFLNHFGSWKKALQLVGLKPSIEWNKAPENELLFDELQRVWELLGRQPLYGEWDTLSKYSRVLYERKFGGWNKAIHAFIEDREKEEEIIVTTPIVEDKAVVDKVVEIIHPEKSNREDTNIIKTPRGVSTRLRFKVFIRDKFTCQYCKRQREEDGVKLEVDHIIAYSKGGQTIIDNLITACFDCNRGKSNMAL